MSGEVGDFELPTDDLERARRFYAATLGRTHTNVPGVDYVMVNTGPVDRNGWPKEVGYIGGGIGKRGGKLVHAIVNITLEDISASELSPPRNKRSRRMEGEFFNANVPLGKARWDGRATSSIVRETPSDSINCLRTESAIRPTPPEENEPPLLPLELMREPPPPSPLP